MIQKTHSFGNPEDEEWLVKLADRKASQTQRLNSFFQGPDDIIQEIFKKVLEKQFTNHFRDHGLNVEELRGFIKRNRWLDLIVSDTFDANNSSLREHLLLTEQILSILLELREQHPFERNLISWFESGSIQKELENRISSIKKPRGRRINLELLEGIINLLKRRSMKISELFGELNLFPKSSVSEKLKLIENAGVVFVNNGMVSLRREERKPQVLPIDTKLIKIWDEERIALELGITVSEALQVKNCGGDWNVFNNV